MESLIKIVVADDHAIFRSALRTILSYEPDFEIVAEATDGLEAIRAVANHKPNLILIDHSMPRMNGFDAIIELKEKWPETKVVALTGHREEEYVLAALGAGADGYVVKDASREDLIQAIRETHKGNRYISPSITETIIQGFLKAKSRKKKIAIGE